MNHTDTSEIVQSAALRLVSLAIAHALAEVSLRTCGLHARLDQLEAHQRDTRVSQTPEHC